MKTILIIDDDELCRGTAANLLRREEWNVIEAEDGEKGIELAVKHRPDVILSDLLMPRGNGFVVCRAVRDHVELRHTKVVVMSGRDYPSDRTSAAEAGAAHYLLKPLVFEELSQVLNAQVTKDGATAGALGGSQDGDGSGGVYLRFWGVRGSIPTPGPSTVHYGGNTSCVEVRADGELVVLDAGTGIRPLGLSLAREFKGQPLAITLLVTHTHWDHIQGFPFFLPAYDAKNAVRILGYEGAAAGLAATLAGQMESPYFPIALKQMPGNLQIEELRDMEFTVGKLRVTSCFSKHPGVCVGYRLHTSAGSIVYLPDNEWSSAEGEAAKECEPCTQENTLLEFIRGTDVLILDAQYDQDEYSSHKGWGHGCVDDVVRLAQTGDVKRLYLFHHDPEHDDAFLTQLVEHARELVKESGGKVQIEAAREGEKVILRRAVISEKVMAVKP